jgi:hypothetical protein
MLRASHDDARFLVENDSGILAAIVRIWSGRSASPAQSWSVYGQDSACEICVLKHRHYLSSVGHSF